MNFENPNQQEDHERTKAEGELNFELQRILIRRSILPGEDLGHHAMEWIEQLAPQFPIVFEELLIEYPNIIEEWKTYPPDECENIIAKIEDRLPAFNKKESKDAPNDREKSDEKAA